MMVTKFAATQAREIRNMEKRLKVLEEEVSRIKGAMAIMLQYEDDSSVALAPDGGASGGSIPKPHERPKPKEVVKRAREIILNHGMPMKRAELFQALITDGFQFAGDRAINTLGVALSRHDDKFENIEGYGYWPADHTCPDAGYFPEGYEETPEKPEPNGAALH